MRKLIVLIVIMGLSIVGFFYLLSAGTSGSIQHEVAKIVGKFGDKNSGTGQLPVQTLKTADRDLLIQVVNNVWAGIYPVEKTGAPLNITPEEPGQVPAESTKKEGGLITNKEPGYIISLGAYSTYENALTASSRFKKYTTRVVKGMQDSKKN